MLSLDHHLAPKCQKHETRDTRHKNMKKPEYLNFEEGIDVSRVTLWEKVGNTYGRVPYMSSKQNGNNKNKEIHTCIKDRNPTVAGHRLFREYGLREAVYSTLVPLAGLSWDETQQFQVLRCLQRRESYVTCLALWLRTAVSNDITYSLNWRTSFVCDNFYSEDAVSFVTVDP